MDQNIKQPKAYSFDQTKQIKLKGVQIALDQLKTLKQKRTITAEQHFKKIGHTIIYRRIYISGGIGAIQWMPKRKVWRIQIQAAIWSKKQWKYAKCIEI